MPSAAPRGAGLGASLLQGRPAAPAAPAAPSIWTVDLDAGARAVPGGAAAPNEARGGGATRARACATGALPRAPGSSWADYRRLATDRRLLPVYTLCLLYQMVSALDDNFSLLLSQAVCLEQGVAPARARRVGPVKGLFDPLDGLV